MANDAHSDEAPSDNVEAQPSLGLQIRPSQSNSSLNSVTGIQQTNHKRPGVRPSISMPNFGLFRRQHTLLQKSMHPKCTPEPSVYLSYAPEPTVWPIINWPANFWLFMAAFLFAGLETTYGAFLHSFTLRTLLWTPVIAVLFSGIIFRSISFAIFI